MAKESTSNSLRFIGCYNSIDQTLKKQGRLKRSTSYTEAVRRMARTNALVRKYEEDLIDFGRLRNAIVHNADPNQVIAEPHLEVVEKYEKIAKMISQPPLAINTISKRVVGCIEYNVKLKKVIAYGYETGFSNIPVFKDGMLIGVANGQKILDVMGKKLYEKQDLSKYIEDTEIQDVIKEFDNLNYYAIVDEKATLETILSMFAENRKLLVVLITKTGSLLETPIGIITTSDIMEINQVLDDYR